MKSNDLQEKRRALTLEELDLAIGGTDYSYAYPIISEIIARFNELMVTMPEDAARKQVKNEYWNQVIDICIQFPDACDPQEQAEVIFAFTIGSV